MEISSIEIQILCKRISESINGYFLSSLYSMESGALLRLNHSTKPEKLVAISSFAPWITTKNLSVPRATKFVSLLRDQIERDEVRLVNQVGNERIARFLFEGRKGEKRAMYAEFFSHGNIILTDPDASDEIICVEKPQSFRHRAVVQGQNYVLPPMRGIPLRDINYGNLTGNLERFKNDKNVEPLSAIKWFGRNFGTSRKFVEEIFWKAQVEPDIPVTKLQSDDLQGLVIAANRLVDDLEKSETGYILLPTDESELEVDVCPIIPRSWKVLEDSGKGTIQKYSNLSEALDEVQVQALVLEHRRSASTKARLKAGELSSAIEKQTAQIARNKDACSELKKIAHNLMTLPNIDEERKSAIANLLLGFGILEKSEESGGTLRFTTEPRSYFDSYRSGALASRIFDEAKQLDSRNERLELIRNDLERQREGLLEQTRSLEDKAERRTITERRERQWFERYRWFVTSDYRLAVGGRDSTSNSIIINKYTDKNDIAFHADLHGSPFFVLKNSGDVGTAPRDEIALELSQATVSFSRAWKDELGSADAYWITPDQIKKGAPSGEYLPRGSFFIEGKKNFVRHVRVELSVGIISASDIPVSFLHQDSTGNDDTSTQETAIVVCGPEKALAGYCFARVRIAPGKEKASDFAKRLKQQLVNKVRDDKLKESAKKLQIDEIMRILPPGSYKVLSEKQNN